MSSVAYARVSGTIFALVALAHLYRAAAALPAQAGSFVIPVWWSWVVAVVGAVLALWGFRARA
jgi:hypothetical protein